MVAKRFPPVLVLLLCVPFGRCAAAPASSLLDCDLRFGPALTAVEHPLRDSLDGRALSLDMGVAVRLQGRRSAWGIQAEILYASRQRRSRDYVDSMTFINGAPLHYRGLFKVRYLQATLLARAAFRRHGKLRPYVLAGPYAAWGLSSEVALGFSPRWDPIDPTNVRAHSAGAIFGIGVDLIGARADRLSLEVRLDQSFADVLTDTPGVPGAWRTLTIQLAFAPFAHRA